MHSNFRLLPVPKTYFRNAEKKNQLKLLLKIIELLFYALLGLEQDVKFQCLTKKCQLSAVKIGIILLHLFKLFGGVWLIPAPWAVCRN